MSTTRRVCGLTVAVVALALAIPHAYAFNPQPDPPARQKMNNSNSSFIWFERQKSLNNEKALVGSRNSATSGPCKAGTSCDNHVKPGLKSK